MNLSEISLINAIFIQFTVVIVILITLGLFNLWEIHLTAFFVQFTRYGKHKFSGPPNPLISKLEVPKVWFKHFYVFSAFFSLAMFWLTFRSYVLHVPVYLNGLLHFRIYLAEVIDKFELEYFQHFISLHWVELLYCGPCTALFVHSWVNQFQSNVILANLRKYKSGKVVTQTHKTQEGGYFEEVSWPNMYFELLLYTSLEGIFHLGYRLL